MGTIMCHVCVHLYPYQTIADFFKTTTGFFLSTENSLHCQYCFSISQNLLRALKQTYPNWPSTTTWLQQNAETASNKTLYMLKIELDPRQLEKLKSSRRCRAGPV